MCGAERSGESEERDFSNFGDAECASGGMGNSSEHNNDTMHSASSGSGLGLGLDWGCMQTKEATKERRDET